MIIPIQGIRKFHYLRLQVLSSCSGMELYQLKTISAIAERDRSNLKTVTQNFWLVLILVLLMLKKPKPLKFNCWRVGGAMGCFSFL